MGKSNNKRAQKRPDKSRGSQNTKNFDVVVTPPESSPQTSPPKRTDDELFDDFDYEPEISTGAASSMVLQSPVVKMLGGPTLQNVTRPTLVEISKEPPSAAEPAHKLDNPVSDTKPTTIPLATLDKAIGDLEEFKNLEKSSSGQSGSFELVDQKTPDASISDEYNDAPDDITLQDAPNFKGSQKLDDLQDSLADVMADLGTKTDSSTGTIKAVNSQQQDSVSANGNKGGLSKDDVADGHDSPEKSSSQPNLAKQEHDGPTSTLTKPETIDAEMDLKVKEGTDNAAPKASSKKLNTLPKKKHPTFDKKDDGISELHGAISRLKSAKDSIPPSPGSPNTSGDKVPNTHTKDPSKILEIAKAKTRAANGVAVTVSPGTVPVYHTKEKAKATIKPVSSPKINITEPSPQKPKKQIHAPAATVSATSVASSVEPDTATNFKKADGPDTMPAFARPASVPTYDNELIVGVAVVGFHHTRGPEVEYWVGPNGNQADLWPYLPFQSMPDGSHSYEENICYFTVLYDPSTGTAPNPTPERDAEGVTIGKSNFNNVETLFGISCTRQISADDLQNKTADVTRSTVLKSLVVLARKPVFGPIKEKLKVVTRTYFDQKDFEDRRIIDNLYENIRHMFKLPYSHSEGDFLVGTNPRQLLHNFGMQVMVMFKALLLEKKIAFYASDTEALCTIQFTLVSLIPDLLNNLQDCGSPLLTTYETKLEKPTFLRTSDRASLLKFLGLPLQVFAAGGMFTPFLPLQLIDELKQPEMQYGMFGSTNKVLFSQNIDYDLLVDIDLCKVTVVNQSLRKALDITSADKAFLNPVIQCVKNTWDSDNSDQPTSLGYDGSDDYIRHSFEDYLIGLVSSAKYQQHLSKMNSNPNLFTRSYPSNPLKAFNSTWAEMWQRTNNYRIFNKFTDEELFDIVEPQHIGLLKDRKRSDAISEVRGVVKEDESITSPPIPDTLSGKFFSMFGWSNQSNAEQAHLDQEYPSVSTPKLAEQSEQPEQPQQPATPSDTASNENSTETPKSPARKLFFWK